MKSQNFLFIVFCLVMVMGLMQSYFTFQEYFSPHKMDLQKISSLQKSVEQQKLKIAELENQVVDFQQEVAVQLPALDNLKATPESFQVRNLASVTQKPLSAFQMSGPLSERARGEFRRGEFKAASRSFRELTQKYPTSPQVVEAYFFMAESFFMSNQAQDCLDVVDEMMTQFPQHELTGFIMLRMGQILQTRNRSDEAKEVYRSVVKNFSANHELKVQAEKLEQTAD